MFRREMVMREMGLARAGLQGIDGRFADTRQAKSERKGHMLTVHVRYTPTTGGGKVFGWVRYCVFVRVWRFLKSGLSLRADEG
jgi:hypothetical protein